MGVTAGAPGDSHRLWPQAENTLGAGSAAPKPCELTERLTERLRREEGPRGQPGSRTESGQDSGNLGLQPRNKPIPSQGRLTPLDLTWTSISIGQGLPGACPHRPQHPSHPGASMAQGLPQQMSALARPPRRQGEAAAPLPGRSASPPLYSSLCFRPGWWRATRRRHTAGRGTLPASASTEEKFNNPGS